MKSVCAVRPRRAFVLIAFLSLLVVASGCRGGRFNNVISRSQEIQIGQDAAADIDHKNKIVTAGPQYERLQRVASHIIPLAHRDYDVPFSVKLIQSKDVNAFALPGGPIYFYTGLMDLAGSDDEVAAVLGHEATHVVRRHSVRQISDAQMKGTIAEILFGNSPAMAQNAAGLFLTLTQLTYSREDEAQADEYGFQYLTEAGYDPDAMAGIFRKLESQEGNGGGPVWLQNHPLTKSRIEVAEHRAAEYKQEHGLSQ